MLVVLLLISLILQTLTLSIIYREIRVSRAQSAVPKTGHPRIFVKQTKRKPKFNDDLRALEVERETLNSRQ